MPSPVSCLGTFQIHRSSSIVTVTQHRESEEPKLSKSRSRQKNSPTRALNSYQQTKLKLPCILMYTNPLLHLLLFSNVGMKTNQRTRRRVEIYITDEQKSSSLAATNQNYTHSHPSQNIQNTAGWLMFFLAFWLSYSFSHSHSHTAANPLTTVFEQQQD